ncbi:MAG: hypothetical protein ACKOJF_05365 [Planctomycetaceae bacterium]
MALDVYKEWLGIPEGPRPPDHYALLRLKQFDDDLGRVRKNYKTLNGLVRKYATGQYQDESQALLNELAKAMLCLTDQERKREYDESLGREFPEEQAGPKTIEQVLITQKYLTRQQAQEAKEHAERSGLDLRDALVQLKLVDAEVATQALAQELGLSYVDLGELEPDESALDQVPKRVAKQYSVLPLFVDQGTLLVAAVHELDHAVEEELRLRFDGAPVRSVLASKGGLDAAIAKYYAPGARAEGGGGTAGAKAGGKSSGGEGGDSGKKKGASQPAAAKPVERPKVRQPLSAEERKKNQQLAGILVGWSVVAAYLLDNFVVTPRVFFDSYSFLLFLGLPALAAAIACATLLQKR